MPIALLGKTAPVPCTLQAPECHGWTNRHSHRHQAIAIQSKKGQ